MKKLKHLFVGLVLGILAGWALGFLRLPYIEKNFSFLIGFMAALAFVSLAILLQRAWNEGSLPKRIGKESKNTRARSFVWALLSGVLVLGGAMAYGQYVSLKDQIRRRDKQLQEMAARVELAAQNDQAPLMRSVLEDVLEELKHNPGRALRDTTIARIATLSFLLKPYPYFEADSLSGKSYSPGRGQLLQALVLMEMDTGTFARIKRSVLFAGADLRGAVLKGLDLSGINLQQANLKDADLSGANLKGASLSGAYFWGAKLNQSDLSGADLRTADLSWAQLNEAALALANLNGAQLGNAQLRRADLRKATIQWSKSGGALFEGANLAGADCFGANLSKVHLGQADLGGADLRKTNLSETELAGARLNQALVDEKWSEKLKEWQPGGAKALLEGYTLVNDTFDKDKRPLFRLKEH